MSENMHIATMLFLTFFGLALGINILILFGLWVKCSIERMDQYSKDPKTGKYKSRIREVTKKTGGGIIIDYLPEMQNKWGSWVTVPDVVSYPHGITSWRDLQDGEWRKKSYEKAVQNLDEELYRAKRARKIQDEEAAHWEDFCREERKKKVLSKKQKIIKYT